jgi:hypothetical protein
MSRLEAHPQGRNDATASAQRALETTRGTEPIARAATEPAGAIARIATTPPLDAQLFQPHAPATAPALPRSPTIRAAPSSEWWVQITLCVVVTILLLAVIAVPKRNDFLEIKTSRQMANDLLIALQKLRNSIGAYRFDHGTWPGTKPDMSVGEIQSDATKEAMAQVLEQQLVGFSDVTGETSPLQNADCPLGPYLESHLPMNPIAGLASVHMLGDGEDWPEVPDETSGWIYQPRTGEVRANCRGLVPVSSLRFYDL